MYTPPYAIHPYALFLPGPITLSLSSYTRLALFVSYATHALYNQTPGCTCFLSGYLSDVAIHSVPEVRTMRCASFYDPPYH